MTLGVRPWRMDLDARRALRGLLILATVVVLGQSLGCHSDCQLSEECPEGNYCDFDLHRCVPGCQSDEDCGYRGRCERRYGICRAGDVTLPTTDASVPDCGESAQTTSIDGHLVCVPTSTTARDDAGPTDA